MRNNNNLRTVKYVTVITGFKKVQRVVPWSMNVQLYARNMEDIHKLVDYKANLNVFNSEHFLQEGPIALILSFGMLESSLLTQFKVGIEFPKEKIITKKFRL